MTSSVFSQPPPSAHEGSTALLVCSSYLNIGNFGSSSLKFKMTTTASFKKMPCRIMIYHNALKTKFFVDSEFTLSSDNKTAYLNTPLGNIAEKLKVVSSTTATPCSLIILVFFFVATDMPIIMSLAGAGVSGHLGTRSLMMLRDKYGLKDYER